MTRTIHETPKRKKRSHAKAQRRKGTETGHSSLLILCVFAPLRETLSSCSQWLWRTAALRSLRPLRFKSGVGRVVSGWCRLSYGKSRAKSSVHFALQFLSLLVGIALPTLAVSPLLGGERLAQDIAAVIQAPEYRQAHWGILAVDLADGRTVYELNSEWMFAPASVTKLYSVAAALDAFGADSRFETPLVRRGEIDKEGQLREM